jgi:CheY-like chemotaxis protein
MEVTKQIVLVVDVDENDRFFIEQALRKTTLPIVVKLTPTARKPSPASGEKASFPTAQSSLCPSSPSVPNNSGRCSKKPASFSHSALPGRPCPQKHKSSNPMSTILLVEDEENDAFFFQRSMEKANIANPLQIATDGQQALDYLHGAGEFVDRDKFPFPSLVVLDLKLPRAHGFEVLAHIRQHPSLRKLIVVVLTSSVNEEDIAKAYELGANAYLVKPSDTGKLLDIIQSIKLFWLTHNHAPPIQIQPVQTLPAARVISRPRTSRKSETPALIKNLARVKP